MAGFQASPLRAVQTTGIAGEVAFEGPLRSTPWTLLSTPEINGIGLAYTQVSDGNAQVGGDIGSDPFVGILGRPKEQSFIGDGTTALGAFNALPDGATGDLITMGILYIQLSSVSAQAVAGVVGSALFYNDTTGIISAGTAGAGESVLPNAEIVRQDVADDGLAIVSLTN